MKKMAMDPIFFCLVDFFLKMLNVYKISLRRLCSILKLQTRETSAVLWTWWIIFQWNHYRFVFKLHLSIYHFLEKKKQIFTLLEVYIANICTLKVKGQHGFFSIYLQTCNTQTRPRIPTKLRIVLHVHPTPTLWKFDVGTLFLLEDMKV